MSTARLTARELQARLVQELGDDYRYTERTLRNWANRAQHPLPSDKDGQRGHLSFDWDQVLEWLEAEAERQDQAAAPDFETSLSGGVLLTIAAVARELEMSPDTVRARLRDWNMRPVETRTSKGRAGVADYYRLRDILDALTASARAEDPDTLPASERDAYYRSELRKDELRRNRRELIEVDEARAVLSEMVAVRRDFYDLLPDMLEHKAHLDPAALAVVEREINAARTREVETLLELHARLTTSPVPQAEAV
jgi:hypothetical protein